MMLTNEEDASTHHVSDCQHFRDVKHLFHCEIVSCIFDGINFFTCIFMRSFRHHFKTIGGTEMADVE